MREAARLANADGFIREMPNGYDTELGERGCGHEFRRRWLLVVAVAVAVERGGGGDRSACRDGEASN